MRQRVTKSAKFRQLSSKAASQLRKVLRFIETTEMPKSKTATFNNFYEHRGVSVELNSWADRTIYAALLNAIGPNSMGDHLVHSEIVQSAFLDARPIRLPPKARRVHYTDQRSAQHNAQLHKIRKRKEFLRMTMFDYRNDAI